MKTHYTFVVVGGGIAGVSCVETLAILNDKTDILLIASSEVVKATSAIHLTKTLVELDVEEVLGYSLTNKYPNISVLTDTVIKLNHSDHYVETETNGKITFEILNICTGGRPHLIEDSNPNVIGLRDTESVTDFQNRIKSARRILVVGNGGIASEIVHEVKGVEIIWAIKDDHISKTFLDAGAGEFIRDAVQKHDPGSETIIKRVAYEAEKANDANSSQDSKTHPALGPDWHRHFDFRGSSTSDRLVLELGAEVHKIGPADEGWSVSVQLSNNHIYNVDFIVSATGVTPNTAAFTKGNENLRLGPDGGIWVDWKMETSLSKVFAAGDVCYAGWEPALHWHQMRLWTQARQMGSYSAKCMMASLSNETVLQDFAFEIFSHVTKLYGYKVILLGLFNGQKLNGEYELLLRVTKGKEYVKLVMKNGKMQGALLIGETDLEEMCENLILNQLDLTPFGEDLLNPDIDIEDYFD